MAPMQSRVGQESVTETESITILLLEIFRTLQRLENTIEGQNDRFSTIEFSIRSESPSAVSRHENYMRSIDDVSRPFSAIGARSDKTALLRNRQTHLLRKEAAFGRPKRSNSNPIKKQKIKYEFNDNESDLDWVVSKNKQPESIRNGVIQARNVTRELHFFSHLSRSLQ